MTPEIPKTRMNMPAPAPAPVPMPMPTPTPAARPMADAKKTRMVFEDQKPPVAGWLVAISGKYKGEDFRIRSGKTSIGSSSTCDVVLKEDYVSGTHATIKLVEKDGERIFILSDLDSSNGTFLNDSEEPIAREELVDNDTVTIGQTRLKFKCL